MKTYTAGEDESRLAAAALALGLQQYRNPRPQVRQRRPDSGTSSLATIRRGTSLAFALLLDSTTEDARIRSIDSQQPSTECRSPSFSTVAEASSPPYHGSKRQLEPSSGGSLPAAVLGVIKGMVGPAILYLPHGFASAGYLIALPVLIVSTSLYLYSSRCLLDCWTVESRFGDDATSDSNGDCDAEGDTLTSSRTRPLIGVAAVAPPRIALSYPELAFRGLGSTGGTLVKIGIAMYVSANTYIVPRWNGTYDMTLTSTQDAVRGMFDLLYFCAAKLAQFAATLVWMDCIAATMASGDGAHPNSPFLYP